MLPASVPESPSALTGGLLHEPAGSAGGGFAAVTPRSELRLPVPPVSLPLHPGGSLLPFASLPSLPAHSHFFVTKISKFQWPGHSKVLGASAGPVLTSISSQDVGWSPLRRGRGCQLLHQADKNRWCVRAAQQHSAPALAMCQPARDLRPCWRQVVGFLRRTACQKEAWGKSVP